MNKDVEGVDTGRDAEGDHVVEDRQWKGGRDCRGADKGGEERVGGKQGGAEATAAHGQENLVGEMVLAEVSIGCHGGVKEGL